MFARIQIQMSVNKSKWTILIDNKILVNDLTSLFQSRAGQILNDNNGVIKFTI